MLLDRAGDDTEESDEDSSSDFEAADKGERRQRPVNVANKEDDGPEPTTEDDEQQMGGPRSALTDADLRQMARYIGTWSRVWRTNLPSSSSQHVGHTPQMA